MAKEFRTRRGNTTQHSTFVGASAEITVNTDTKAIRVHDGITAGGFEMARTDLNNVSNATFAAKATAAGISGGGNGTVNGADANSSYIVAVAEAGLLNERVLQAGNAVTVTDGGPGGGFTIAVKLANTGAPSNLGSASLGASVFVARADHVHAMPTALDVSAIPNTRVIQAGTGIMVSNSGLLTSNSTISLNATLQDLTDVAMTGLSGNQMLIYNGATSKWENYPYSGNLSVKNANTTIGTANAINTLNFIGNGATIIADPSDPKKINVTISRIYDQEEIEDIVGSMVSGNTESGLAVTYDDTAGKLNFDVADFSISLSGPIQGSATVTNLASATISTTISPNSITLGTDTVGSYVGTIAATGTPNGVTVASTGGTEGTAVTVSLNLLDTDFIEGIQDIVGGMVSGSTQSGIGVTYSDSGLATGKLNFDVADFTLTVNGAVTGAATITNLASATLTTSLAAGAVTLGTHTTGTYLSGATPGLNGNGIVITGSGSAGANVVVALDLSNAVFIEGVQDIIGTMVSSNTESGINVTYDDPSGKLNFDVNDPIIALTGAVTGSATMTNLGNVSISTTYAADSITLGSHTTGNYVASVVAGLNGNGIVLTGTGEGAAATVSLDLANAVFIEGVQDIIGTMLTGNTESGILVTYDDSTAKINFDVNDPIITLTGAVTGTGTMTNLGNVSISTTLPVDSVTLGTHTVGNYVANVSATGGVSLVGGNSTTEAANLILTIDSTNSTFIENIQDIVGAMITGNVQTGVIVTYDDPGGKVNFAINSTNLNADTVDSKHATDFAWLAASTNTFTSGSNQILLDTAGGGLEITKSTSGAFIDLKNSTGEDYDVRIIENAGGVNILTTASGVLSINGNAVYHAANLSDTIFMEAVEDTVGTMLSGGVQANGVTVTYTDNGTGRGKLNFGITGGAGSGLDADKIDGYETAKAETGNTVVVRENAGWINSTRNVIASTTPNAFFKNTGASANMGRWQLGADNVSFNLYCVNDAESITANAVQFTRNTNATTISSAKFIVTDNAYVTTGGTDYKVLHTGNLSDAIFKEQVEDYAANMILGGTHTGVTVTYTDAAHTLSLAVNTTNLNADTLDTYDATAFPRKGENNATITAQWRFNADIGLDAGRTIWFGREELFGGSDTGTNDYGYVTWDNDNNTYAITGTSSENGCLRIGSMTDATGTTSDSVAIEPSADIFLNPGSGLYFGNASNRKIIWHEGNDGASSGLDADLVDGYHAAITNTANTIAVRDATNTIYATTFSGTATSAKYADVAERYWADNNYAPGTVVVFGGEFEITESTKSHDTAVAGVISTAPAYMLNSEAGDDETHPYVALVGRVPCQVIGPVKKGDLLTTSEIPGYAKKIVTAVMGSVIGKALENFDGDQGLIEISVQRS